MYLLPIIPFHPTSYLNSEINKCHLYYIYYDCEILQTMNSILPFVASNPLIRSLSSILILIFCTSRSIRRELILLQALVSLLGSSVLRTLPTPPPLRRNMGDEQSVFDRVGSSSVVE